MPGKRMGPAKSIRGGRPAPVSRGVAQRPMASAVRRGASVPRNTARDVKRQAVRSQAQAISSRPRPVVRPVSVPKRVMPPAASAVASRPMRGAVRPSPVRPAASPRSGSEPPVRTLVRPSRATIIRPTSREIKRGVGQAAVAVASAAAVGSLVRLNTATVHPDISFQVNSLQSSLTELENRADMTEIRADIANLEANLSHALSLLESARDKGYMYQADMEKIAYDAMSRWQSIRADVERNIDQQARQAGSIFQPVNQNLNRLNGLLSDVSRAQGMLGTVESQVNQALLSVRTAESTIAAAYDDIESQANQLVSRLTQVHWALTQRDEASFPFMDKEEMFMAVKARWDKEGKDDPEGILFLTNQRLIFERKEKVATKKVLFVTTSSELVQEVLGAQPIKEVKNVKAQSKGLFGHQDFLEVDFGKQTVPFHLDGQDSKGWAAWIKNAQSGKLDEDRATPGALSFKDLTGDITQADIIALQNEINELQDEMMLKDAESELAGIGNQVGELTRELKTLRNRGYVVEKSLEADIEVLSAQWETIRGRAQATLEYQVKQLGDQMGTVKENMAKLAGMTASLTAARPLFVNTKSMIASAEAQAEAAEATVLDQYDEYADEIETLDAHLEWVDWMLDAISTASFKLLATESGVAAVEAIWERPGLEPENGILYLTDQRLLWEDRVGDFELKVDVPLSEVKDAKEVVDETTGDERLVVTFGSKAPLPKGEFLLSLPVAEDWMQMIGRARSGDYTTDRAVEIGKDELERIRNAPSQCSNCGAAFTAPILRGQTEIICEFCGVSTRI